jgi:hypothetical protein
LVDIRYYVVSLVAVFLALSLGIVLGSVVVDKGILVEQQNKLVKSIQKDISDLRAENRSLRKEVENSQKFKEEVFPWIVDKRLKGKKIAILDIGSALSDLSKEIRGVCESAGGKVVYIKLENPDAIDMEKKAALGRILSVGTTRTVEEALIDYVSFSITTSSVDRKKLEQMEKIGVLKVTDYSLLPANSLILLPGENKVLMERLTLNVEKSGLVIVGVDRVEEPAKGLDVFSGHNISTVNNIDTVEGKIALVLLLEGRVGDVGLDKPRFLPEYPAK